MNLSFKQHYSPIGLEISPKAIRMAQVKKGNGSWQIHRAAQRALPPPDSESGDIDGGLSEAIRGMIKDHRFHGRRVISTLPNPDVDILPIRLPAVDESELEAKLIESAKARLFYDVDQAVIDYIPIDTRLKADDGNQLIWVIAAQRALVEKHLAVINNAGLYNKVLDIQPCALMRTLVESGLNADDKFLLIHMGERDSLFLLMEQSGLLAERVCLNGYLDMAENLQETLKIEMDDACRLLADYGFVDPTGHQRESAPPESTNSNVHEIVLPVFKSIFQELRNFVTYCHSEIRETNLKSIWLSGMTCLVRNFDSMVEVNSEMRTEILNPFSSLGSKEFESINVDLKQGSTFAVPLGLCLRE